MLSRVEPTVEASGMFGAQMGAGRGTPSCRNGSGPRALVSALPYRVSLGPVGSWEQHNGREGLHPLRNQENCLLDKIKTSSWAHVHTVHAQGRQIRREHGRDPICWFTPRLASTARTGPAKARSQIPTQVSCPRGFSLRKRESALNRAVWKATQCAGKQMAEAKVRSCKCGCF